MKIYKIVAERVCNTIRQMNYKIDVHHVKMKDEDTFTFTLNDDTEVDVVIWPGRYFIHIDGELMLSEKWGTNMSVDGIADEIINNIQYR